MPQLTPHHHRLINLRLDGRTYKEIAKQMGVCEDTIIKHFVRIRRELKIHNTAALATAYYKYREMKKLPVKEFISEVNQGVSSGRHCN